MLRARPQFLPLLLSLSLSLGCSPAKMAPSHGAPIPEEQLGHADFAGLLERYNFQ